MKKNIGKKFRLMAMLASLILICWGGVTACSNGSDSGDDDVDGETTTISFTDEEKVILEANKLSKRAASVKITVTSITGSTTDESWWFWANTDNDKGDDIKWESGEGVNCVYEVTITDANKIAYINENGLAIKGAAGLTAKVTVTITESETTGDDDNKTGTDNNNSGNTGNNENTGTGSGTESGNSSNTGNNESTGSGSDDGNNSGDQGENSGNTGDGEADDGENTGGEQTTTLPTWVGIDGNFLTGNDGKWEYKELSETSIKGIWSVTIENVNAQYPNFQIQAGGDKKIYATTSDWTKVETNGDAVPLVESENKLGTTCWESDSGTTSINLKVTVDFTGEKPTIKLETVK